MPSYLDLAVIVVVLVSGLLAMMRGFTREALAILSWVVAAVAAYYFHPLVLPYIRPYVPKDNIALAIAAAAVFFVTLVVVSVFTVKLSDFILDSRVGALDRTLGFVFGAVRGLVLAVVAFVFYSWLVPDANQPEWIKIARTRPFLQTAGDKLRDLLPDNIDEMVAKLKAKKAAPSEESPSESDIDSAKPAPPEPTEASPEKKTELPIAPATRG